MIYLDHAATTEPDEKVVEIMLPYLGAIYGNPSSAYRFAAEARAAVNCARRQIAQSLHADGNEIFFTSGGSEADNWAIKLSAEQMAPAGRHIVTTAMEHPAVLRSCKSLDRWGWEITYVKPDEDGLVTVQQIEAALRPDTILISVMYANNETGSMQPIRKIGALAKKRGILFHTDAVQAYGQIPIDCRADGIDLLSASAHKLYGPKGVGFLYMRTGLSGKLHSAGSGMYLPALIDGGGQELSLRGGTENVAGIAGFGEAVRLAREDMKERALRERNLKNRLIGRILEEIPGSRLNGHQNEEVSLPGIANISFAGVRGEALLTALDLEGICVSTGSACAASSRDPSHVLLSMGRTREEADASVRFSLGRKTTEEEIVQTAEALLRITASLRRV